MVLAEALLRVPDAATADRLIEDKLAAGRCRPRNKSGRCWSRPRPGRSASRRGSSIRRNAGDHCRGLARRLGLPAVRAATRQAMRLIGSHFVLGQTIEEALARARADRRVSLFLRHAGRRRAHGGRCRTIFRAYAAAIAAIGAAPAPRCRRGRAFRSSFRRCTRAMRPMSRERVIDELVPALLELARSPKPMSCNSRSMPKRPTGSNCRSTSSARCWPIRRCAAGTDSAWRSRPIRSARWR